MEEQVSEGGPAKVGRGVTIPACTMHPLVFSVESWPAGAQIPNLEGQRKVERYHEGWWLVFWAQDGPTNSIIESFSLEKTLKIVSSHNLPLTYVPKNLI